MRCLEDTKCFATPIFKRNNHIHYLLNIVGYFHWIRLWFMYLSSTMYYWKSKPLKQDVVKVEAGWRWRRQFISQCDGYPNHFSISGLTGEYSLLNTTYMAGEGNFTFVPTKRIHRDLSWLTELNRRSPETSILSTVYSLPQTHTKIRWQCGCLRGQNKHLLGEVSVSCTRTYQRTITEGPILHITYVQINGCKSRQIMHDKLGHRQLCKTTEWTLVNIQQCVH